MFVITISIHAQIDPKILDYESKLQTASDEEKPLILIKLSRLYVNYSSSKSIEYAEYAHELCVQNSDMECLEKSTINLAKIYFKLNNVEYTLKYALMAKEQASKNDSKILGDINKLIGGAYFTDKQYEIGIQYFEEAINEYEKINYEIGKLESLLNIGGIYVQQKRYEESLPFFKNILQIDENKYPLSFSKAFNNLAIVYKNLNKEEKAIFYFNKSFEIKESLNDRNGMATTLLNIGNYYYGLKKIDKSLEFYQKTLSISEEVDLISLKARAVLGMAKCYYYLKDYKNAYLHQNHYSKLADEVFTTEKAIKTSELQVKLDLERNEQEIKLLKLKNSKSELELKVSKYLIIVSIIILLSLIIIVINFKSKYALKNKLNKILEDKNADLLEINRKLKISEHNLQKANTSKAKLFSIIGHDLKSPFTSLLAFSEIFTFNYYSMTDEERLNLVDRNLQTTKSMISLLDNLLTWARAHTGKLPFSPVNLIMKDVMHEVEDLLSNNISEKKIEIMNQISEDCVVFADYNMISTVLRNLISNSIKFSPEGSKIFVLSKQFDGYFDIEVHDNGVGISKETITKILDDYETISTKGTAGEKGTGLGLVLCKEFVEKNNGKFNIESQLQKGTIAHFSLPKK